MSTFMQWFLPVTLLIVGIFGAHAPLSLAFMLPAIAAVVSIDVLMVRYQKQARHIPIYPALDSGTLLKVGNRECVYIIQDISVTRYCKIGRKSGSLRRLYDFGVLLPFQHNVVHLIPCDNSRYLERALHRRFAHKRIRGEWFALTLTDINSLRDTE